MADVSELRDRLREWASEVHSQATDEMVVALEQAAPFLTGETVRGISARETGGSGDVISATVESITPQGEYGEYGTRPHVIVPVRASVLRFEGGGGVVYARHVNHPGTPARPWFGPTVAQWPDFLARVAPSVSL